MPYNGEPEYYLWVYNNNALAENWDNAYFEGLEGETGYLSDESEVE